MSKAQDRREKARAKVAAQAEVDSTKGKSSSYLQLTNGVERFNPKKGPMVFDIIAYEAKIPCPVSNPPIVIEDDPEDNMIYGRPYLRHVVDKKSFVCPTTVGKKCPVCEQVAKLNWDNEDEQKVIKDLKAKQRTLYNILYEDECFVWDVANFHFEKGLREELKEAKENLDFQFLDQGKSLRVRFKQSEMSDKYFEADRIDFIDRDDIDPSVLNDIADLNKALDILSYDDIKAIMFAAEDTEEEDDDNDVEVEEPVVERKKPAAKVKKEVVVEEEEVEEVVEEEEVSTDDGWGDEDAENLDW